MNILITEEQLKARVVELGKEISTYYGDKEILMIVLANGAMFFAVDLSRKITSPLIMDTLCIHSYSKDTNTGNTTIRSNLKLDPTNKHILIVDEVFDSGLTLDKVSKYFKEAGAKDIRTAVIVEKEVNRDKNIKNPDWIGFKLPNQYLIGYGLDSNEKYRNLPYIAVM